MQQSFVPACHHQSLPREDLRSHVEFYSNDYQLRLRRDCRKCIKITERVGT